MIRRKFSLPLLLLVAGFNQFASADDLIAIKTDLDSAIKLTTLSANKVDIETPGSALLLKKSSILGSDTSRTIGTFTTTYKKGVLHHPYGTKYLETRNINQGERMWVTKIEVWPGEARLSLVSDFYSGIRYRALLKIPYKDNETASEVLSELGDIAEIAPQNQTDAQTLNATSPDRPAKIELGQTPDQVIQSFGQPDKMAELGPKTVYIYKNFTVTFTGGKVSDVK